MVGTPATPLLATGQPPKLVPAVVLIRRLIRAVLWPEQGAGCQRLSEGLLVEKALLGFMYGCLVCHYFTFSTHLYNVLRDICSIPQISY